MNTEIKSKVCTKCKEEKALEEFHRQKQSKDGRRSKCKTCRKAYREVNREKIAAQQKVWYEANKEKQSEYYKVYREVNREKIAAQQKVYRESNKEKQSEYSKVYYQANRDKLIARKKSYYKANKEEVIEKNKEYLKKRYAEDPVFRTMRALRKQTSRLGDHKNKKTIEIAGCSAEEFWRRNGSPTEEQLQDLHIDHIVPLSWFNLENEDHLAVSSHHSNLQYLSSEDNMAKGSSYAGSPDNIIAYKDDFDLEKYVKDMLPLINIL